MRAWSLRDGRLAAPLARMENGAVEGARAPKHTSATGQACQHPDARCEMPDARCIMEHPDSESQVGRQTCQLSSVRRCAVACRRSCWAMSVPSVSRKEPLSLDERLARNGQNPETVQCAGWTQYRVHSTACAQGGLLLGCPVRSSQSWPRAVRVDEGNGPIRMLSSAPRVRSTLSFKSFQMPESL